MWQLDSSKSVKGSLCSLASKVESYIYIKHKHRRDHPITFVVFCCLQASHRSCPHLRGGDWLYTLKAGTPGDGFMGMTLKSVCHSIQQYTIVFYILISFWCVYIYICIYIYVCILYMYKYLLPVLIFEFFLWCLLLNKFLHLMYRSSLNCSWNF